MVQGAAFRILACFYSAEIVSFAELCKQADYPTDLGGYYIRQLIAGGYLEKIDRGQYRLLPKGKQEVALRHNSKVMQAHPRLAIVLVVRQGDEYIAMRRRRQPFIDILEWPAGAVMGGELVPEAAVRIGRERLGVTIDPQMAGMFRRVDRYDGILFDDKLFVVITSKLAKEVAVRPISTTGENQFYTADALRAAEKCSRALLDIWKFAGAPSASYIEHTYELTAADLGLDLSSPETI